MITTGLAADFDLFLDGDFLSARECAGLLAGLRAAGGSAASVYDRDAPASVDERVRRAALLTPAREASELVMRRLLARMPALEEHFGVRLSECEEPQFLRYDAGGFFVAHQDGGSGLIRSEREARKVSAVVFLNRRSETPEPGAYCGGSLVLHPPLLAPPGSERLSVACAPGSLAAFRSATTHEVLPVTEGQRYTIACWYS
jgi:SM-20-related protein